MGFRVTYNPEMAEVANDEFDKNFTKFAINHIRAMQQDAKIRELETKIEKLSADKEDTMNTEKEKVAKESTLDRWIHEGALGRRGITEDSHEYIDILHASDYKNYIDDLMENKVSTKFFQPVDGEANYRTKRFFSAKFGTPDGEMYIKDLFGFMHQRWFYIVKDPKTIKNLKLKFNINRYKKAYMTNKTVTILDSKENPLRESAWIVVHAEIFGNLPTQKIIDLIPVKYKELHSAWNGYLDEIDDIEKEFVDKFKIAEDGSCQYILSHAEKIVVEDVEIIPDSDEPSKVEPAADSNQAEETKEEARVAEESAALDQQFREAVSNDDIKDTVSNEQNPQISQEQEKAEKEVSFGELKREIKSKDDTIVNPAKIIKTQQNNSKKSNGVIDINGSSINIDENNKAWEESIPRLNKFTKCANKIGYDVIYAQHPTYIGLIRAFIINNNDSKENITQLTIDPCIVYGDTLRIVTNEATDIREECFIPISQENVVVKAIRNIMTKLDKKQMSDKLPECFRLEGKYNILDRVDLRGLMTGDKNGLPFDQWKELIGNINEAISNYPNIRFRIVEYKSPKKFTLVCDTAVLSAFNTQIFREQEHLDALNNNLTIKVDKEETRSA